ncbi:MAG: hypothetical protein F9K40_10390 [Kofleriaceae bacterium]|nr:MAG: hypothetical protein F9K40_10390 [Kofleriaceae bacterium]MBZ0235358.1 hypothetical protein [Kofleriaceae bacterium]
MDHGLSIAVRLRRPENARYRDRITIRSWVESGRDTELQKIRAGPGPDLYLIGVTTAPPPAAGDHP